MTFKNYFTSSLCIMRVPYLPPSSSDFDLLFGQNNLKGGGLSDIRVYKAPQFHQRGGSFFGVLGRLARNSFPFLKNLLLPELGAMANNVTRDISEGVPLKQSLKQRSLGAVKNIGKSVIGRGGRVRKRRATKRKAKNKTNRKNYGKRKKPPCASLKNDIFTSSRYEI